MLWDVTIIFLDYTRPAIWTALVLASIWIGIAALRHVRWRIRRRKGQCEACGYPVADMTCSECGRSKAELVSATRRLMLDLLAAAVCAALATVPLLLTRPASLAICPAWLLIAFADSNTTPIDPIGKELTRRYEIGMTYWQERFLAHRLYASLAMDDICRVQGQDEQTAHVVVFTTTFAFMYGTTTRVTADDLVMGSFEVFDMFSARVCPVVNVKTSAVMRIELRSGSGSLWSCKGSVTGQAPSSP
jgi:hypothetical protein